MGMHNQHSTKPSRQRPSFSTSSLRLAPLARGIALMLAAGGMAGGAQAQQAFSGAWFANKGAAQSTATATGMLPNGTPASSLASPQAKQMQANAQRSFNNFNLAAQSIAAQQATQEAARQAALNGASAVPDGLVEGGLKIDTNSLTAGWLNAKAPVQTAAGGKATVGIEQTAEKAILNWETFNVGRNTTVKFDQKAGNNADGTNNWIALNRINDPSGKPSQIAGQIQADGAVYLINRNGIIFTGSSQVNTRSLVASSLKLTDSQFNLGINNPQVFNSQGNDPAIPQFGEFTSALPSFYGASGYVPGNGVIPDKLGMVDRFVPGAAPGAVQVEAGAQLKAVAGGKIMLFAPKVGNAGLISAPDGQVILAAGENVYLKSAVGNDTKNVRGLDVAVSAVPGWAFSGGQLTGALGLDQVYSDANFVAGIKNVVLPEMAARAKAVGYEVINNGMVQAERGNITMQAMDIRQNGALLASTALNNRNGSIILRAWGMGTHFYSDGIDEMINWASGTLTLGQGSITQILPDTTDTSEIEASALVTRYQPGWVTLNAKMVDVKPQAGVLVPSGTINVETAVNPIFITQAWRKGSIGDASRIYVDEGAYLSVAGLQDMLVPMSRNFIEAELRINELRDSPLLQESWLRGKKVIVDRRANGVYEDGPMSGVQWVQKLDANGQMTYVPGGWVGTPLADVAGWVGVGKTDLKELSADAGSITLRAGGSVITRGGSVLDVSGGSVRYADGINSSTRLAGADGRLYTMDQALPYMDYTGIAGSYTQGHARWGVDTTWRSPLLSGNQMEAGYTEGRKAGTVTVFAGDAMILEGDFWGGTVVGDRQQRQPTSKPGGRLELGGGSVEDKPWSPGKVVVSHNPLRLAADFHADTALGQEFYVPLDPVLQNSRKLTHLSDDALSNSGMGQIVLNLVRGDFILESGAAINLLPGASFYASGGEGSVAALKVDGLIRAPGGSIQLDSINGKLELGAQGRLDASGQWVNTWRDGMASGPWAMAGGAIKLNVGQLLADPAAAIDVSGGGRADTGKGGLPNLRVGNAGSISLTGLSPELDLAALNLRAYSAGSAGSLNLESSMQVQIGGKDPAPGTVLLPATLYGERGFGNVSLSVRGNSGIVVPEGVTVSQQAASIDLASYGWRDLASGERLSEAAPIGVLPAGQRLERTPASINLGTSNGTITIGAGAAVLADAGGRITINSDGAQGTVNLLGRVEAPAGNIAMTANTLRVAQGAQVLARGVPVIEPDAAGHLKGQVLAGGNVSINGGSAFELEAGATIDVSGAYGEIQLPAGGSSFSMPLQQTIGLASDGGSISIKGGSKGSIRVAATLLGHAGGAGASGGSLTITDVSGGNGTTGGVVIPTTLYWRDPITNKITSKSYTQIPDLDLYDEYGTTAVKLTAQIRSALVGLPNVVSGGMEIVQGMDAPGLSGVVKPWEANPVITPMIVDLLSRYFYTNATATTRVSIPDVRTQSTSRVLAGSISGGGFDTVSLDAARGISFADGVQVNVGRALNLTTAKLGNGGGKGSAQLSAAHISLNAVTPYASNAWSAAAGLGGQLTLSAQMIDIKGGGTANGNPGVIGANGMLIDGYAKTVLQAQDIRMGGVLPAQISSANVPQVTLDVNGQLVIQAGQVYPDSSMTAVLRAGQSIAVQRLGEAGTGALSAGGTLRLEAPVIEQNGVLRAPMGQIELNAGQRLTLGADSITSVSGAGVVVPYGTLSNNEHWHDPSKPFGSAPSDGSLTAPMEKRITMKSPDVALAKGAVVDITGGGDLYAWEFVPGPGGSHDVLTRPGMYAILPGYAGPAPSTLTAGTGAGERVWLAGGAGLAAGWYTLLPARYALLPGAFAVQGTGTSWAGVQKSVAVAPDGSVIMQGKAGNAYGNTQDAVGSAWRVMSGGTLRQYSEYNEATANDFFSSEAFKLTQYRVTGQDVVTPRLPRDGGAVVFDATQRLVLDGSLRSMPDAGGRGGLVDIAGKKIAIVGAGQDAASLQAGGYLVIDSSALSSFGAGSLLVGGKRKGDPLGLQVEVTATDIVVRNDAASQLYGPEIILAGTDQVAIEAGSVVRAQGSAGSGAGDLVMAPQRAAVYDTKGTVATDDDVLTTPSSDWGALLRVSNGDAARVVRQNVDTTRGGIARIGAGATVDGGAALLIDATRTTELAGSAQISGRALSVAAGRIGFGGGTDGMVLDTASLAQLSNSEHLTLRSYSSFDFYRSLDLGASGLASLTFDGGAFSGHGNNAVVITGGRITLENSGGATANAGAAGTGAFTLDADTLVLGSGQKKFTGFNSVTLAGRNQAIGQGSGGIDAGSAELTLRTPLLLGNGGAAQSFTTQGALQVLAMDGAAAPADADLQGSLGSRFSLTGASVLFGGRAVALGGSVNIASTAGSVVVGEGAAIDVGGFAKQFFDVAEYADAGRINLSATGGDVRLVAGSRLNLAAHADGGSAGTLSLAAANGGTVVLDGAITAQAGSGGKAGAFALDIEALPDFAGFSQRLNTAGFNRSRQFRIRQGDVVLDGTTLVEDFGLTTDQGRVNITGIVDARSEYGGSIRVTAGNGVSMQGSAQLLAGATGRLGSGRVVLEASGGQLDIASGLIDVSGADMGTVRLRAQRNTGNDDVAVASMGARIVGARSAVLEGMRGYETVSVDAVKAQAVADANDFMGHAGAISSRLGLPAGVSLAPGIEIRSTGDLTLASDWNLFSDFSAAREGTLTLRAAGNLVVNGNLSDGFDQAGRSGVQQDAASWNLRLVAGADLGSAYALSVKPIAAQAAGSGSIIVGTADTDPTTVDNGAGKAIRTGTGDIEVRAGRDLMLAHKASVIYTAGRKDMTTWADFTTAKAGATYGIQGGHLDINAQGSISAQPSGQRFVEWLNRQGNLNAQGFFGPYEDGTDGVRPDGSYGKLTLPAEQSSWWVNYGMFEQGVAAFGGGNVKVAAGGDLGNLVVALTSNMRMRGGLTAAQPMVMEVRNGGAMSVEAGGAIRGGQYYVARGAGDIRAGETATGQVINATWELQGRTYQLPLAPILSVGDAAMSVRTAGNLRLQTVVDPLLVRIGVDTGRTGKLEYGAYMSGYTDRTALSLVSTGGNITFVNQSDFIFRDVSLASATSGQDNLIGYAGNLYPAYMHAAALNGSLEIQGPLQVVPGNTNDVRLVAQRDVRFNTQNYAMLEQMVRGAPYAEVFMAYATPEMMPLPTRPAGYLYQTNMRSMMLNTIGNNSGLPAFLKAINNPDVLPLADDFDPSRIYAADGSILGLDLTSSEQTWVRAGTDIRGVRVSARNIRPDDVTLLEAGNDILAMVAPRGSRWNPAFNGHGSIRMQGPGALLLSAGRDVYADNLQIQTTGNRQFDSVDNRPVAGTEIKGLPTQGASINVMAGMNQAAGYGAFARAYVDPANIASMPDHLKTSLPDGTVVPLYLVDGVEMRKDGFEKTTRRGLVSYMLDMTGETLAPMAAWERFQQLQPLAQQQFLRQVYLLELREAGRDQNEPGVGGLPRNGGYNRGYAAISTLFPGDAWKGDVAANTMMLRTMAGGDVNVLTPGGGLQVAALGATVQPGYGLVTLASGHINVFAKKDVVVNRSRILSFVPEATRQGSDQIIWSTVGDIDAGRGSKTVRVPSAPEVLTDVNGNTIVREKSDMSGSGIGTVGDGDVDLVAPLGTVNAGDAGIRVAGNLNIAALHVVNADNIQVKGEIKGLPPAATVNIGALTNASAAAAQASAAAQDVLQRERAAARQALPSVFTVRVLGFGNEPPAGVPSSRGGPGGSPAAYDPKGAVEVLGQMDLGAAEMGQLTATERRNLRR